MLKFVVGLQTEGSKMGVKEVRSDSRLKGQERWELLHALSIRASALCFVRLIVNGFVRESLEFSWWFNRLWIVVCVSTD